jgi:putative ABC transport system ATP-binding protein
VSPYASLVAFCDFSGPVQQRHDMSGGQGQPLVSICNVSHSYGWGALRKQVLHDITADVRPGEIVIVTGPSGSGKTTMLTLMGALRSVQQGSLRVFGTELQGAPPQVHVSVRQQIGYIFQSHNLLDALTACQNVQMSLGPQGLTSPSARSAALAMLDSVGLADHSTCLPRHLSGGQRQRAAIARALVRQPRLVLADEPTSSLDKESGRAVVEMLHRLARRQGCSVLIVTHDHRILDVADRVMQLDDGRLRSFAEPISTHAVHLLTALARLPEERDLMTVLNRLREPDLLELLGRVVAETEQFLNVLEMAAHTQVAGVYRVVLKCVFAKVAELLQSDGAHLFSLDRERNSLRLRVSEGEGPMTAGATPDWEIAAGVAETGHPVFSEWTGESSESEGTGEPSRHLMALPLRDRLGRMLGVSQFVKTRNPFTLADERTFRDYARSLSLVLEVQESLEGAPHRVSVAHA